MHIMKIVSVIVVLGLFLSSCIKEEETEMVINHINVGGQVPPFMVEDTIGNTFSSKQFLGKQSLLVFFGTYCSDCKRVLPVIEEVWKEMKDDPKFLLIPVSRDETAGAVSEYWKKNGFTMPFYLDTSGGDVFSLFANNTIPRLYIINSNNEVAWMTVEELGVSGEELIRLIKGEKEVSKSY